MASDVPGIVGLDLALSGGSGSVPAARHQLRSFLELTAVPGGAVYDALLVATELVTNACRHASGPCRVTARIAPAGIEIAVRDTASEKVPGPNPAHRFPEHHGLGIVTALTGAPPHVLPVPGGKVVSAVLPHPSTRRTPASRTFPCLPADSRSRPAPPVRATAR